MSAANRSADVMNTLHKELLNLAQSEVSSPDYYVNKINNLDYSLLVNKVPIIRKASALLLCLAYRNLVQSIKRETDIHDEKLLANKIAEGEIPSPVQEYVLDQGCPLIRKDDLVYIWLKSHDILMDNHYRTSMYNNKKKRFQHAEYLLTYILETKPSVQSNRGMDSALWLGVYWDKIPVLLKSISSLESLPDPTTVQIFMDVFSTKIAAKKITHEPLNFSLLIERDSESSYSEMEQRSPINNNHSLTSIDANIKFSHSPGIKSPEQIVTAKPRIRVFTRLVGPKATTQLTRSKSRESAGQVSSLEKSNRSNADDKPPKAYLDMKTVNGHIKNVHLSSGEENNNLSSKNIKGTSPIGVFKRANLLSPLVIPPQGSGVTFEDNNSSAMRALPRAKTPHLRVRSLSKSPLPSPGRSLQKESSVKERLISKGAANFLTVNVKSVRKTLIISNSQDLSKLSASISGQVTPNKSSPQEDSNRHNFFLYCRKV